MKNYILANPLLIEQDEPQEKKKDSPNFTSDIRRKLLPHEKAAMDAGYGDEEVEGTPSPAIPDPAEPETWIPFVADKLDKSVDEIGDPSNWTEDQMVRYLRIALGSLKQLDNTAYNLFLGDLATTMADDLDIGLQTAFEDLLSNEEEELKADLDAAEEINKRFGDKLADPNLSAEERKRIEREMKDLERELRKQRKDGAPTEDGEEKIDIARGEDWGKLDLFRFKDLTPSYGETLDQIKKEIPRETGESNEAYLVRRTRWAVEQLVDGAYGLDLTEIQQFMAYMSEGEFEKAWNEIAPNLEAVTDQTIVSYVEFLDGTIDVEGKYAATAAIRSKDELSTAFTTAATTTLTWLILTKLLPGAAKYFAKKRALKNLVTLGKAAKLTPTQLLELAKDKLDGPIENWFKGEAAFEDALNKAAKEGGWDDAKKVWGSDTVDGITKAKRFFAGATAAGSETVSRSLLGGPIFYDVMATYYDNILQSEMGIEVAKKMLEDLKEATGYDFATIDDAKEALQKVIDRDAKKIEVLNKLTKEGSPYNNENLLKLKDGETIETRLTGIYNSAPAGTSLSTNAEDVLRALDDLKGNKNDQDARRILMQFLQDYKKITKNSNFRPRIMARLIINHGWPDPKIIESFIDEAKELKENVKKFKAVSDNLKKQINTLMGRAVRIAKNKTTSMMRAVLPAYENGLAAAATSIEGFADIADTNAGLNKLFRNFEDALGRGRGSLDLLKLFVKKAADVTAVTSGLLAGMPEFIKDKVNFFTKPRGGGGSRLEKFIRQLINVVLESTEDTSKTKYYLLTEESKRQSNENFEAAFEAALKKLIDEAGKEIDSKTKQEENEIDSQIATAEADVTASMDGLYDMIKATARTALSDDIETIFGPAMSLPADEAPANESKIRITKSKLIDLISEQVREQTQTVDVTKDQLVALVAQEAFKQINRKK
jgi:hypothetical protein